jgi:hypothetical protein
METLLNALHFTCSISVDFVDPILATEIEVTMSGLDRAIKRAYPQVQRIFIEVETWRAKEEPMSVDNNSDTLLVEPLHQRVELKNV